MKGLISDIGVGASPFVFSFQFIHIFFSETLYTSIMHDIIAKGINVLMF